MDQLQKIVNKKIRSISYTSQKKKQTSLIVDVSDDSDFEDVFIKGVRLADQQKEKKS